MIGKDNTLQLEGDSVLEEFGGPTESTFREALARRTEDPSASDVSDNEERQADVRFIFKRGRQRVKNLSKSKSSVSRSLDNSL